MSNDELQAKIDSAQDDVAFWEQTVSEREKTARGLFSSGADKEDLRHAQQRLREARAKLDALRRS